MKKSNKKKDKVLDDFQKLKNEMIIDQVNEIFRAQPGNYKDALEEMGFEYHEDDDPEELEEKKARPRNRIQRELVEYFEGQRDFSEKIFLNYLHEKESPNPNYPLIRKYYKQANQNLRFLILCGLDHYPHRIDLLSDLAFFHEFERVLSLLITYYTRACLNQSNLKTFTSLAEDFFWATNPDGYEALLALRELFEPHTEKRTIIEFLISASEKW